MSPRIMLLEIDRIRNDLAFMPSWWDNERKLHGTYAEGEEMISKRRYVDPKDAIRGPYKRVVRNRWPGLYSDALIIAEAGCEVSICGKVESRKRVCERCYSRVMGRFRSRRNI